MTDTTADILDMLRRCDSNHAALSAAKPGDAFRLYGRVYSRADVMVGTMPHCWSRYGCPADIEAV